MPPLEVIQSTGSLTSMIRFKTSAVYEMMIGLQTCLTSDHHLEWKAAAHKALPADFWTELKALYDPLLQGKVLVELGADYYDHDDVPGFIAYMRDMDAVTFMFYFLGRTLTPEQIASSGLEPKKLVEIMKRFGGDYCHWYIDMPMDWILTNLASIQQRLAALWTQYWELVLSPQLETLRQHWLVSISDKERILARDGARTLLEMVTGSTELPPPLPVEQPTTDVVFIPIYHISSQVYKFFGYGNMTVLFDSERSETELLRTMRAKDEVLVISKALGDATRLKILRLITVNDGNMHGKKIAEKLKMSASAVSRQLAQLRDAGLIVEEPGDDQTVNYRLQKETIKTLPELIFNYLGSPSDH
jgi:DNA-binding transcriptional ArsR family regulator